MHDRYKERTLVYGYRNTDDGNVGKFTWAVKDNEYYMEAAS